MRISVVTPASTELNAVRALWRANSATLGFFPDGAFADHASQGWILAAVDGGAVVGFLTYRLARARAVIVHLCVADESRGRGVARALFVRFRTETAFASGAAATCRSDFGASDLWPKLGFHVVDEREARESGRTLQHWWLDYGHPDLFTAAASDRPAAVLDANVFFDLLAPEHRHSGESMPLQAPWVRDAYDLRLTPEVFAEIQRSSNAGRRHRARRFASTFTRAAADSLELDHTLRDLTALLGAPSKRSDVSDHRQLAHAIGAAAAFFVTRDGKLLDAAEQIADALDIEVVRPLELISRLDLTTRPEHYLPARLEGSALTVAPATATDEKELARLLHNAAKREPASGFAASLREALSDCRGTETLVVRSPDGVIAAGLIARTTGDGTRTIQALRVRRHRLDRTLARHLLWREVNVAAQSGVPALRLTDRYASAELDDALTDVGFVRTTDGWLKLNVRGALTYSEALAQVDDAAQRYNATDAFAGITRALEAGWRPEGASTAAGLERTLWPLKLRDAALPSYLVPIKPGWAAQLFHGPMAAEQLFGADSERVLRLEHAYYRAARPAMPTAPGRILWYASMGKGYSHAMHVCAASAVSQVVTGPATEVFRQFRRYGIFEWRNALATAGGEPQGRIMAFSFSHTEAFRSPLSLPRLRAIVEGRTGRGLALQSPALLPGDTWCELYTVATNANGALAHSPARGAEPSSHSAPASIHGVRATSPSRAKA